MWQLPREDTSVFREDEELSLVAAVSSRMCEDYEYEKETFFFLARFFCVLPTKLQFGVGSQGMGHGWRRWFPHIASKQLSGYWLGVLHVRSILTLSTWWLGGKESAHNARHAGSIPGLGRSSGGRNRESLPTPVFLPGEFHGQRRLAGYSPWGCKEWDRTEWLTLSLSTGEKGSVLGDHLLPPPPQHGLLPVLQTHWLQIGGSSKTLRLKMSAEAINSDWPAINERFPRLPSWVWLIC